jgi:hypothetical protein
MDVETCIQETKFGSAVDKLSALFDCAVYSKNLQVKYASISDQLSLLEREDFQAILTSAARLSSGLRQSSSFLLGVLAARR